MKTYNNADTYLGAISLVIGILLLIISYQASATVFVLPGDAPPFLVPQVYLYLWIVISAVLLIGGIMGKGSPLPATDKTRLVSVICCVAVGAVLMKYIGFVVAGFFSVVITCLLLAYKKMWVVLLTSTISVIGIWALLTGFADMSLPTLPGMRF